MLKEILEDTKIAMDKSLKALDMTYKKIRTGRAQELYNKWIGEGDMPSYIIPGTYY